MVKDVPWPAIVVVIAIVIQLLENALSFLRVLLEEWEILVMTVSYNI